jgi:hypothetical protein
MPDNINIAGVKIIDIPGFLEFVLRFALNTGVIMILVRLVNIPAFSNQSQNL